MHIHTWPVERWASTPCVPFVFEDLWEMSALTFRTGSHCQSHKCLSCRCLYYSWFPSLELSPHGRIKSDAQFSSSFRSLTSRSWWPWMQEKSFKKDCDKSILWWKIVLLRHSDSSQSNGHSGKWKGQHVQWFLPVGMGTASQKLEGSGNLEMWQEEAIMCQWPTTIQCHPTHSFRDRHKHNGHNSSTILSWQYLGWFYFILSL